VLTGSVAAAMVPLSSGAGHAAQPVQIHERWVDVVDGTSVVCGVVLEYSGRVTTTIHLVEQPSGGFHVTIRWGSQNLTATAPDGTVYRDVTHGMESKTATAEWVVDDDDGTFTENAREQIRVFAPGGGEALLLSSFDFHVTKVNGQLRVVRDTVTHSCAT
jgi:hypothetical protein